MKEMRKKIMKIVFALFIILFTTTNFVLGTTYNLNKELKGQLEGKTLGEATTDVKSILEKHGYNEQLNGTISLKEGEQYFSWTSKLEMRLTDDVETRVDPGTGIILDSVYKIRITYNGENKGTYEFHVSGLGDLPKQINDKLHAIGITNSITENDLNAPEFNKGQPVLRETKDDATLTIKMKDGRITEATADLDTTNEKELEVTGEKGKGSKERPSWFKKNKTVETTLSDPVENPEDYNPGNVTGYSKVFNIAGIIIATVKVIGVSLSVILLVIIGIKYLMGSIEEKAEYKKTMIPYVVGIVLLFAGSFLVQIIYDLVKGI